MNRPTPHDGPPDRRSAPRRPWLRLLGGAGALESLATLLALRHRRVPPTINLDNPEPDLGIDIATKVRDLPEGDLAGVNNSFGFGGHNVAVAFTNRYSSGG